MLLGILLFFSGIKFFKDRFAEKNLFGETEIRNTTCGDFKFNLAKKDD